MKVAVIRLRDAGRKLARAEHGEPAVGLLVVEDWPAPNALGRWCRRGRVLGRHGSSSIEQDLLPPLFDPQIIRADETGLYLAGTELQATQGAEAPDQHAQIWWCKPA